MGYWGSSQFGSNASPVRIFLQFFTAPSSFADGTVKGEKNPRAQPVVCLEKRTIYPCARAAAIATNGHEVGISEACHGGGSHRKMHRMFVDEWERQGRPLDHPSTEEKPSAAWSVVRLTDGRVFPLRGKQHGSVRLGLKLSVLHARIDSFPQQATTG